MRASASARALRGGIRSSSSSASMRRSSSLLPGSPGTIARRHRQIGAGPGLGVEAQVRLALGLVGTVAVEAEVGEDRPNVAIELDVFGQRFRR